MSPTPSPAKVMPTLLTVDLPEPRRALIPLTALQENAHGASNHLLASLRSVGQLHPILVEQWAGDHLVIHAGNRRVAAARKLGWTEIQADVYCRTEMTETAWALVLAGDHNRSVNPVDEARAFERLAKQLSLESLQANTGVPIQTIRARLALLSLPTDVLELIGSKALSLGVAERASRLKGVHLSTAVSVIRSKAAADESFTQLDLKAVTLARRQAFGQSLAHLQVSAPALLPEAELLALEIRELCARRHVPLSDVLVELQGQRHAVDTPLPPQLQALH